MKILVLNWQDVTNKVGGGAEVHLHEIFRRLVARGHEVTLFCDWYEGAAREDLIDGIRIIREGSRNLFNFHVPWRYWRRFKREDFDVVVDDINKIPFYTPLYVRRPLVGIVHHFFGKHIYHEVGAIAGTYVYLAENLVGLVYRRTPMAIVSESTRDEMLTRGFKPEQLTIVANCIDQRHYPFAVGTKSAAPTITYFGRVKRYKSVDHLLHAFARIAPEFPGVHLHIAGGGDFIPALRALATTLGIAGCTTIHGYVTEEKKMELLSTSWMVVNPSVKEGWGIINIEANACGTPVISADSPGLRDSVKEGQSGTLYPYGDIGMLAARMRSLITDTTLRTRLSEGAVQWARQFDWEKSADVMEGLLRRVIGQRG
jgi:glycosyltransferase involved in cell wall biosynthesis